MALPDDFRDDGSLFPTMAELRAEEQERRAERMGRAVARAANALERILARIEDLPSVLHSDLMEADMEDAERVADVLELAVERLAGFPPC